MSRFVARRIFVLGMEEMKDVFIFTGLLQEASSYVGTKMYYCFVVTTSVPVWPCPISLSHLTPFAPKIRLINLDAFLLQIRSRLLYLLHKLVVRFRDVVECEDAVA